MTILLKIIAGLILYLIAATVAIAIIDLGRCDITSWRDYFEALWAITVLVTIVMGIWLMIEKVIPWCIMTLWGV